MFANHKNELHDHDVRMLMSQRNYVCRQNYSMNETAIWPQCLPKGGPPIGVGWVIQGWCGSYKGGWVMHEWGVSNRDGVGCVMRGGVWWVMEGWGVSWHGVGWGVSWSGGVGHGGVGWVMDGWGWGWVISGVSG